MTEFTTQNVVTVRCPVVHRSTTVKNFQMLQSCTNLQVNLAKSGVNCASYVRVS